MPFDILLDRLEPPEQQMASLIWSERNYFFRWPVHHLLLWPECVRPLGRGYHEYPAETVAMFRNFGLGGGDRRSNGPAVMSYQIAGGELVGAPSWPIHHIYDGLHPLVDDRPVTRAVTRGDLFSEAAGLVAAHPVAHEAAHRFAYIAWNLRLEAFRRFDGFDPDNWSEQFLHEPN